MVAFRNASGAPARLWFTLICPAAARVPAHAAHPLEHAGSSKGPARRLQRA